MDKDILESMLDLLKEHQDKPRYDTAIGTLDGAVKVLAELGIEVDLDWDIATIERHVKMEFAKMNITLHISAILDTGSGFYLIDSKMLARRRLGRDRPLEIKVDAYPHPSRWLFGYGVSFPPIDIP